MQGPAQPPARRFEPSENEPLDPLLNLRTGGPARWFYRAHDEAELQAALRWAEERTIPVAILGGGSNLICADEGYPGLVIALAMRGITWGPSRDGKVMVTAAAAEPWDAFVRQCCDRRLAGLECLSGVPGTVGATPIQNVGAYGQEVAQTIASVRCLERASGESVVLSNQQCGFAYRHSRFKAEDRDRFVVLSVDFELREAGAPLIAYPELQRRLAPAGSKPDLDTVRQSVLELRAAKSMLLDPNDPNGRNCGSFFVNPVLDAEQWSHLRAVTAPEEPPHYPQADGRIKVPAAWLIERAGFTKGHRDGNVGISTKHSLCLVAHQGATTSELLSFAHHVRDTVQERLGVVLVPEPVLLGTAW
jgi:UDP-N-acetylmuramate dehydrogenase